MSDLGLNRAAYVETASYKGLLFVLISIELQQTITQAFSQPFHTTHNNKNITPSTLIPLTPR
jgi:hypothetical protein